VDKDIFEKILTAARNLTPVVEALTGTKLIQPAIAAAEQMVNFVDEVMGTLSEDDQAQLQTVRDDLEARVNAHADRTIDRLG
jgi:hypothetical protein